MDARRALAERFCRGFGRVVTHRQNLVLTDVPIRDLAALHEALASLGLATPTSVA